MKPLSWATRLHILLGVVLVVGVPVLSASLLFADMLANRGNAVARHLHHQIPECSTSCHQ